MDDNRSDDNTGPVRPGSLAAEGEPTPPREPEPGTDTATGTAPNPAPDPTPEAAQARGRKGLQERLAAIREVRGPRAVYV